MGGSLSDSEEKNQSVLRTYAMFTGYGLNWGVVTLLGIWVGKTLDEKLATAPAFLIVGGLIGIFAGFLPLLRLLLKPNGEANDTDTEEST